MLLAEREDLILSLVQRQGVVSVRDLADACAATEVTIRRDLTRLEARNLLRRTHGGAVRMNKTAIETPVPPARDQTINIPDALILAPVQNWRSTRCASAPCATIFRCWPN